MTYRNRHILRLTISLTVLLAAGNAMAQTTRTGDDQQQGNQQQGNHTGFQSNPK